MSFSAGKILRVETLRRPGYNGYALHKDNILQKAPRKNSIFRRSSAVERLPVDTSLSGRPLKKRRTETRTYADRREELKHAVVKRRRKVKALAVAYKGGRCQVCGYAKYQGALDLHHLDPKLKEFGIADTGYNHSWDKIREEVDKCVLVCANCHREIEGGVTQLPEVIQVEHEVNSGKPSPAPMQAGDPEPSLSAFERKV